MKKFYIIVASLLVALLAAHGGYAQCNTCRITGPTSIALGQTATFSTATQSGASYYWSATGGLSVQSGTTSATATIKANSGTTGKVCVTRYKAGTEPCSNCRTISITSNSGCIEPTSVFVSPGTTGGCGTGIYSFNAFRSPSNSAGGTYTWTVYGGGNIISGQGTNSILAFFPTNAYYSVEVELVSTCNNKTVSYTYLGNTQCGGGIFLGTPDVYPNPASSEVTIEVPQATNGPIPAVVVEVVNSQGEVMLTRQATSGKQTVSISSLPKGLYYVRMRQNGQVIKTTRLVKEQ